jgi:hypothetical protein
VGEAFKMATGTDIASIPQSARKGHDMLEAASR